MPTLVLTLLSLFLVLLLVVIPTTNLIFTAQGEHPSSSYLDPKVTYHDILPPVDYAARGYESIGKQHTPVSVSNKCLFYFSQGDRNTTAVSYGRYVAEWLALRSHSHPPTSSIYFTYDFPWAAYNLTAGWKSGLAQGLATECFLESYMYTGNNTFLDLARKSLMFLVVPIEQGGVMIEESENRWWYEEYPRIPEPSDVDNDRTKQSQALNGHQFVLIALGKYLQQVNYTDATIQQLFNKGLNALKFDALMYDYGYNASVYDRVKRAPANEYHETHIINFQRLYDLTGDEELLRLKRIFLE